jgi:plasmid stability protein
MTPAGSRVLQVEQFPEDLRRQLKIRAVRRNTTLRQEIITACMALLAEQEPRPAPAQHPDQITLPL